LSIADRGPLDQYYASKLNEPKMKIEIMVVAALKRTYPRTVRNEEAPMTLSKGVVVPPGGGKHLEEASGQVMSMKLFGRETDQSVTLFEQTVPAGSKNSWLHLHRDSDEIAWVLEGEFTFKIGEKVTTGGPGTCAFLPRNVPHAWKNSGSQPGRVVFLYTPAGAGRFVEGMLERPAEGDLRKRLEESGWEVLGPNPL
jgi:quercetin dioxygenase-like cupin family protein